MRRARYLFLVEKAAQAAVAAIEVYNKPGFQYREETFAILMVNAWELLLKARILKENRNRLRSIEVWERRKTKAGIASKKSFPKLNRAGNALTIGVFQAAEMVRQYPVDAIDKYAIENISLLAEIRDNAVHFHNVGNDFRKRVQEIGAAALRNFAFASVNWFDHDLSKYQFALMPVAFETPGGVLKTMFTGGTTGAAGNVARLLAEKETEFPFEPGKPYNVGVEVELRFVRKPDEKALAVKIAPNDPNAISVKMTEDDFLKTYPWSYNELCASLRKKPNFKENALFHKIRRPLESDARYCRTRQLDPRNKKSSKKTFYSPNIVAEILKGYT